MLALHAYRRRSDTCLALTFSLPFWLAILVSGLPVWHKSVWAVLHVILQFDFAVGLVIYALMILNRRKLLALLD